ncbi:MAG: VWA domain-containing protein [Candidatus Omnitrophica bacterium]|nr:VWA domain-containing protein [Candidatus Omnitrophota bacterium]
MKKRRLALLSFVISASAHAVLLTVSFLVWIPGVSGLVTNTQSIFQMESVELKPTPQTRPTISQTYIGKVKFEKPASGIKEMMANRILEAQKIESLQEWTAFREKDIQLEESSSKTLAPPDILGQLKEQVDIAKKKAGDQKMRSALDTSQPRQEFAGRIRQSISVSKEILEGISASSEGQSSLGSVFSIGEYTSRIPVLQEGAYDAEAGYESLDEFLTVRMLTYRDPEDGIGYYQISIHPSPYAKGLETMPKEIVFLIDASMSIRGQRLTAFREGIKYALRNLNPGDKFNLYVFKSGVIPFAAESLTATGSAITHAASFLDSIQTSEMTDIYSTFLQTIQRPPAIHPSYIVLLSDGKPTRGVVSSAKLISEITRTNAQTRPIFAFSGGHFVNHFLMDFLAYQNRGWSEYAEGTSMIQKKLQDFYDKIKNPVLVNVRYQLSPLDETEVYPKNLPDFYRDAQFTLYGRYRTETKFSVRILGEIGPKTKEFIYAGDLSEAPQGTRDLARFWALSKCYYLISQMAVHGADPKSKEEIRSLIRKFELEMPYDVDRMV